jgi:O-antigen/teichoic acid export membrane protein
VSHVRINIVANAISAAWSALAQIVCIPVYLTIMGPEAYGLVGFYVTVQISLQIFDLGLSPTMNRELARFTARAGTSDMARDFVRTVESGYWLIGVLAAIAICSSAGWISTSWVRPTALSQSTVRDALFIMGCVVALQWPLSLYQGGLIGLQRQVRLNLIKVIAVTASTAGSIIVLKFVSPTITAFFLWQVIVSACHVVAVVVALWLALPKGTRAPRFDFKLLRDVMPFAGGMAGIAFFGLVLTQMDKVLLSKLLSLEDFGYYVLAGTIAGALQLCIGPIFNAVFPRLTALVALEDSVGERRLYHIGSQTMAFALAPVLVVLCGFSTEIIRIWTGNEVAALHAGAVAPLLVAGTALNGMLHLPHALRLAHGWTRLDLGIGLAMIILFVPSIILSAQHLGGVGTAGAWALLNISALFITVPLTHRRLLQGDTLRWIFVDTLAPWAAAAGAVWLAWIFLDGLLQRHPLVFIPLLGCLAVLAAGLTLPEIRHRILQVVTRSSPAAT